MARGRALTHTSVLTGAREEVLGALGDIAPHRLCTVSLVGSHAYGLEHADSDRDYRGVYMADPVELLGLHEPKEQFEHHAPDLVVFELGKFARLARAANPNVLEILWGPVVVEDGIGARLRAERDLFLSQRVRDTYIGYAKAQVRRALRASDDSWRARRRAKSVTHVFRLLETGERLLRTGEMRLRVDDPEAIRAYGALNDEDLVATLDVRVAQIEAIESPLPVRADEAAIEALVREIRLDALRTSGALA